MRKSLVLFALIFAYIWGCSSSEDKYSMLSKDERKAIASICSCMEPLTKFQNKMQNATDTATRRIYKDSFEVKAAEMLPCLESLEKLELKSSDNKDYRYQFTEYVKDKHPDCVSLFLGISVTDTTKKNK